MKLVQEFNKFRQKLTEKKNERLLKKYNEVSQNTTTASVLILAGLAVPPVGLLAMLAALPLINQEKRLKKKLEKRGLLTPQ